MAKRPSKILPVFGFARPLRIFMDVVFEGQIMLFAGCYYVCNDCSGAEVA